MKKRKLLYISPCESCHFFRSKQTLFDTTTYSVHWNDLKLVGYRWDHYFFHCLRYRAKKRVYFFIRLDLIFQTSPSTSSFFLHLLKRWRICWCYSALKNWQWRCGKYCLTLVNQRIPVACPVCAKYTSPRWSLLCSVLHKI